MARKGRSLTWMASILVLVTTGLATMTGHIGRGALEQVGTKLAQWLWPEQGEQSTDPEELRLAYYRFEGPTMLDQIQKGRALSAADGFAYTPQWLKNEVFESLTKILRLKYQQEPHVHLRDALPYDVMEVSIFDPHGRKTISRHFSMADEDPFSNRLKATFKGAHGPIRGPNQIGPLEIDSFFNRVSNSVDWTIRVPWLAGLDLLEKGRPIPWDRYSIVGRPTHQEVGNAADPLSRVVMQHNPGARDIVLLEIYPLHGSYHGTVLIRELKLLVLGIENIGSRPFSLKGVLQRQIANDLFSTETVGAVETRAKNISDQVRSIPLEALKPGEHLMVPLRLELGIVKETFPGHWWRLVKGDEVSLEILREFDRDGRSVTTLVRLSKDLLEARTKSFESIIDTYVLGPSIDVKALIVKRGRTEKRKEVRRFDSTNIVVSGGFEKGSCPILYVAQGTKWRRLGPVLVDAVSRDRRRVDTIFIPAGHTRFLVVEEEDETAFIDFISLEGRDKDGMIWRRELSGPSQADGRRVASLGRGESVAFEFQAPPNVEMQGMWQLKIGGYYVYLGPGP